MTELLCALLLLVLLASLACAGQSLATEQELAALVGKPADLAPSAYGYRADISADRNAPESWLLLMQYAGQPFDKPAVPSAPAIKRVLRALLWEEVRPIRRIELTWPEGKPPQPDAISVLYMDASGPGIHTWWNRQAPAREATGPEVSADGRTFTYSIPSDTFGLLVTAREPATAADFSVPEVRAYGTEVWKELTCELEWGFEAATSDLTYEGRLQAYDGVLGALQPLPGDAGTTLSGAGWKSKPRGEGRRGVQLSLLYIGGPSRWQRIWPFDSLVEDVSRTLVTVTTNHGGFTFKAADLENGPILAPEYGFFIRSLTAIQAVEAPPSLVPGKLLADKTDSLPGVPLIRGWSEGGMPWFGVNPTSEAQVAGSLAIPARCAAMHPSAATDIAAGWRSPLEGKIEVSGSVAMGDSAAGNGVDWSVVLTGTGEPQLLASGAVGTGGRQDIPATTASVKQGELVSLVLDPKQGNHGCDTTVVELRIREQGGQGRVWSLADDVLDDIQASNPHSDHFGNPDIWWFYGSGDTSSKPPFEQASEATSAKQFEAELKAKGLLTIRERVREAPDQTWLGAVRALHPSEELPPFPEPPYGPRMEVQVPSAELTAQWKLGAWHLMRRAVQNAEGTWRFNDYPFALLASENYLILRALDLMGLHQEAADGLDQWLELPLDLPKPTGWFSDGLGVLSHAKDYVPGAGSGGFPGDVGGGMDSVHAMGPGAIGYSLAEHYRLTGDFEWLKTAAPRLIANAEWILRQRSLVAENVPGGERLACKGLQPAHQVTPDSGGMLMQFYESDAYYWLAVKELADILVEVDPAAAKRLAKGAEAYREDLLAAVERSILLSPVCQVRDGTYHSFVPFGCYVRGFASEGWNWRRPGSPGHVNGLYWDTVQSALPLFSPAELLPPDDVRVQGFLDVLEDRLLLENERLTVRTPGYDPDLDWLAHAGWQYQCGLERQANLAMAADDAPCFLRTTLNQYAVDVIPGDYNFREHTVGGPPDKSFEESAFLERFRDLLVYESGNDLWLCRAAPREWLAQGQRISVKQAPTAFGEVSYEVVSSVERGYITAIISLPEREAPGALVLRLRHPEKLPIKSVTVEGRPWEDFSPASETIRLTGFSGEVRVRIQY